jgi:CRP-like cAMP-binding protein
MMKNNGFATDWLENVELPAKNLIYELLKPVHFTKDEFVHRAGDKADGLFFIEHGKVRINKLSEQGKELLIVDLLSQQWFGFIGCFGSGIRPNDAIALEDTTILLLSRKNLDITMQQFPSIAISAANFLAKYVEIYGRVYEHSVFKPLDERLTLTLKKLCQFQNSQCINISQHDLAAMLGVTKEAIGINLNALKAKGIVALGYRKIELFK